ncbi:MAG: hypothetical protein QXU88_02670 [Candidatus Woesearchaeota archaeon]
MSYWKKWAESYAKKNQREVWLPEDYNKLCCEFAKQFNSKSNLKELEEIIGPGASRMDMQAWPSQYWINYWRCFQRIFENVLILVKYKIGS